MALTKLNHQSMPTDSAIQVVHTNQPNAVTSLTTMPSDDTIPTNTEGAEMLTLAITPKSATSKLLIDATLHISASANNRAILAALFQDSGANAIAVTSHYQSSGTGMASLKMQHYMTSGTTSSTTFKIRVGASASASCTLNGYANSDGSGEARYFNGKANSSITITEIAQ